MRSSASRDGFSPPGREVAWRAVIPAFLATTTGMMPGLLIAGLAVQIRAEIGLTLTGLGILLGSFFGIGALVSTAMGTLSERVGWAAALRIATLLTAVSLSGIGWLAGSPSTLTAFLVVGGIASSLGQIASNLAVARCVAAGRQGLVFGLRHASVPAAALLAGIAVPTVALTIGWRWAFRGAAFLALIATASVPAPAGQHTVSPPLRADTATPGKPATPLRLLVVLAVAAGLGTGGVDTIAAFLVSYSVDIGIGEKTAGLLLAAGSLCGIITRVVAGWVIDRIRHADLTAVATMIALGAVGVILLNLGGRPGLLLGGLLGFTAGWGWAGLFTFAVVKDNPEAPAAASGITQTGKYLGVAIGAPVFGAIADNISFTAAWWATTAAMLIAAGLILYVRTQRPSGVATVD